MEAYLNRSIKEVIKQFPEVEGILDDWGIGCGPCSVGDCLLKDIVEIHHLAPQDKRSLLTRISRAIHPDRDIELTEASPQAGPRKQEIRYSPPLRKLVEEHKLIKRCIALLPQIVESADLATGTGRALVLGALDFIRSYADRYHHAKEEDILFKYFDPELDILKAMHREHECGRGHVRTALEGVERGDREAVAEHLLAYAELLSGHIRKEDEILYPWLDRNLSTSQVGQLFGQFTEVDKQLGDTERKYSQFIESLEERFCHGRAARLS